MVINMVTISCFLLPRVSSLVVRIQPLCFLDGYFKYRLEIDQIDDQKVRQFQYLT